MGFSQTIPFVFSTAGYGFVLNMPGYGHVAVGEQGVGGMRWDLDAALGFDFWITTGSHHQVYRAYADATGHSPMLPEDAMVFWCVSQPRASYPGDTCAPCHLQASVLAVSSPRTSLFFQLIGQPWHFPSRLTPESSSVTNRLAPGNPAIATRAPTLPSPWPKSTESWSWTSVSSSLTTKTRSWTVISPPTRAATRL